MKYGINLGRNTIYSQPVNYSKDVFYWAYPILSDAGMIGNPPLTLLLF